MVLFHKPYYYQLYVYYPAFQIYCFFVYFVIIYPSFIE